MTPLALNCLVCGKSFEAERKTCGRHPGFCSPACRKARHDARNNSYRQENRYPRSAYPASVRKTIRKICLVCEAIFETTNPQTECCGLVCGHVLGSRRRSATRKARAAEKYERVCKHCGASFTMRPPSGRALRGLSHEGQFCSRKCAGAARRPPSTTLDLFMADRG